MANNMIDYISLIILLTKKQGGYYAKRSKKSRKPGT